MKLLSNGNIETTDLEETYAPSLVDYSTWVVGTQGSQSGWSRNGLVEENEIILKANPLGETDIVWATEQNDIDSNGDGGWVSGVIPIDNTALYRVSYWVKRENAGNGRTYMGYYGYTGGSNTGLTNTSGEANYLSTNPYPFTYLYSSPFNREDWILNVYFVQPYLTTVQISQVTAEKGSWLQDGTRIYSGGTAFCFTSTNNGLRIRSYLFYSTSTSERQYWYRPRLDKCDGSEPSISELLALSENENLYGIKPQLGETIKGHFIETTGLTGSQQITSKGYVKVNGIFEEV